ncbi:MAG: M18 family aminopeptidase [Myxococcota bacterium]
MTTARQRALDLLAFIDHAPTAFHATEQTAARLASAGFEELREQDAWRLSPGDRRYVLRNGSSIVAFVVGASAPESAGFIMAGAHTDSPVLKLKPCAGYEKHGYRQLGVETYGGLLLSTWLDRDLGLAGRVVAEGPGDHVASHLVHIDRPIARIPNIAIHLNREVNTKGLVLDQQKHLPPILGMAEGRDEQQALLELLSTELAKQGVEAGPETIVDFDLALVDVQPGSLGGVHEEFLWAPRIDNLASCHAALTALIESAASQPATAATRCLALWDNEECGSRSMQGAQGPFLRQVLGRVVQARSPKALQAVDRAFASSFLVSVDMAHALHPNYADRHEPEHRPMLGKGPVIKHNANQAYASDAISASRFARACRAIGCTPQRFVVRSDMPCGSTIGPITAALTGIKTVDVGNPMLSMHSIRETAAVADHAVMIGALEQLFGTKDTVTKSGKVAKKKRSRKIKLVS